jgi:hypothetical protein
MTRVAGSSSGLSSWPPIHPSWPSAARMRSLIVVSHSCAAPSFSVRRVITVSMSATVPAAQIRCGLAVSPSHVLRHDRPMADAIHIDPDSCGECASHRPDAAIAALAKRQHGVVARWQLVALGLSRRVVEHRVERGRLHVLYRGVYAVGHRAITREARWIAAVLTAPGSVLSHRSAGALWGIRRNEWRDV